MKRNFSQANDLPEPSGRSQKNRKLASGDPALTLSNDRAFATPVQWGTFQHIVVLGDSYSSAAENNWVGLLRKCLPYSSRPTIHNFAKGGDTVEDDLTLQLKRLFTRLPTAEALEGNGEVLFVIWLGINDCGRTEADELEPIVAQIFEAMHDLYTKWKARAFLLIDVPPMHRSPGEMGISEERYTTWNSELLRQAETFAADATKASVLVVSSYAIISDFLDDPEAYGMSDCIDDEDSNPEDDNGEEEPDDSDDNGQKAMWADDIHRALANRLWTTLQE
ncbi:carbohydrate esterase family 16 protein [Hebeloma cylindrosporum]|uniref:Carbohydrate esterase family 16 protein n=1 Tax=Hebeloma cylindrosporum TaxID=76867 RepID=A0A0C3CBZ4_HEBCY|nr:carbohydrate esterase family 16 protein [Hebeloma cylindrosporum h7]